MGMALEADEAVFENVGQAVHVAFMIMAQEATQDAPLRKALIRAMESIQLSPNQRNWLVELRGVSGGTINFGGLDGNEIRAQCAMVTQAVKSRLPAPEMWVLQAKFGQTEFEDVVDSADAGGKLMMALEVAQAAVADARVALRAAGTGLASPLSNRDEWLVQMEGILAARRRLAASEADARIVQIAIDQARACKLVDNGRPSTPGVAPRRRYVFSAERIAAITGLADWFRPMFPGVPALAIDCLLGRMFANHKKIDITFRDMAQSFGGSHLKYYRAALKMKVHVKQLEQMAMERLEPIFAEQGVTMRIAERI